jgi:hypothetical protein
LDLEWWQNRLCFRYSSGALKMKPGIDVWIQYCMGRRIDSRGYEEETDLNEDDWSGILAAGDAGQ